MNTSITPEVWERVDAHLDAVERHLDAAGISRAKRRGIVDDLETHIVEMINGAGNRAITLAEVNEMLGRLDPPEAYAKATDGSGQMAPAEAEDVVREPRLCRQAWQGVAWIALGLGAQMLSVLGCMAHVDVTPPGGTVASGPSSGMTIWLTTLVIAALAAALVAPIIGTSLGWIAVERIRNSGRKLYGLVLAVFDALFYPLIVIWLGSLGLWYWIIVAFYDGTDVPNRGRAIWLIGSVFTGIALSVVLVWLLRRLSRPGDAAD
ncbi:MAG: hypothetical protein M3O30_03335 [Planctomycetota bacterium]|nr:hypothetical protein [Planctomycetota bacterium]